MATNLLGTTTRGRAKAGALCVTALLGAGLAAGACGTAAGAPAASPSHGNHQTPTTKVQKPTQKPTPKPVPTSAASGLEGLGRPQITTTCKMGGQPVYTLVTPSAPATTLVGWPKNTVYAHGFLAVGGGACGTTLTWTLPRTEHELTAEVALDIADSNGTEVQFAVNGKTVKTVPDGPSGATVSIDLAGAHTVSVVVPKVTDLSYVGPVIAVIGNDHLS